MNSCINIFCQPTPLIWGAPGFDGLVLWLESQGGGSSTLRWGWSGTDPVIWTLYGSIDGGAKWTAAGEVWGVERTMTVGFATGLVKLISNEVGAVYSNIVDLTPAPDVPADALTNDDGQVLTDDDGKILTP